MRKKKKLFSSGYTTNIAELVVGLFSFKKKVRGKKPFEFVRVNLTAPCADARPSFFMIFFFPISCVRVQVRALVNALQQDEL